MPIQAVVTDLDNTLLHSDKSLSTYTAGVLARLRRQGVKTACATARPLRAVKAFGLDGHFDAVICQNGGLVVIGGREAASFCISPADTNAVVAATLRRAPGVRACIEAGDALYANTDVNDLWPGTPMILTDFAAPFTQPAHKVIFAGLEGDARQALAASLPAHLYLEVNLEDLCLVMHQDAAKLNALRFLLGRWGIPLQAVAAFGDDTADIELLAACGHGVAVANAVPAALKAARHTCKSNNEDGVARWLEENVPAE